MKIALAQINPTVGDFAGNSAMIQKVIFDHNESVDLIVFPEMSLTGYPPQDLLFEHEFITTAEITLNKISENIMDTAVILGTIREEGAKLYNTAAILQNGKIIGYRDKTLRPAYDVFNENRYFSESKKIQPIELELKSGKVKIGILICEDLWDDNYDTKVTEKLNSNGAELFINISASPFYIDKFRERYEIVKSKSNEFKKHFIYCNLVGAQDELIFDGASFAVNSNGECIAQADYFNEEVLSIDIENTQPEAPAFQEAEESIVDALSLGVRDYFRKTGHTKAILGLSGGIDSALTAAIACNALNPENVLGVSMPSVFSSDHSVSDAETLAVNLGMEFKIIPIKSINESMIGSLNGILDNKPGLAEENLQARIRGNILMTIANKTGGMVLNTGNKTETALGYCTLYGDMCGAIGVISDLTKTQVYAVSNWINKSRDSEVIPIGSLTKPPSAELKPEQVDPFDYEKISPFVEQMISGSNKKSNFTDFGLSAEESHIMKNKIRFAEYKRRQAAPGLKISKKAFGIGRRFPIVNKFRDQ